MFQKQQLENISCASYVSETFAHTARDGAAKSESMVCENQLGRLHEVKGINELLILYSGRQSRKWS